MHPVLFRIPVLHIGGHAFGGFDIYTYGVVLAAAFLLALWLAMARARTYGISPERVSDLSMILLIAGVVGSRLLFVLEEWPDYAGHFREIFDIREGGLSISGGLILAFLAGAWYVRKYRLDFWRTADAIAPAIPLGMGLGRIGCFFNGCCVGTPTTLPWAFVFTNNPRYFGPRHPTQLYEMILDLAISAFLVRSFKSARPGTPFLWCVVLVSTARFLVEFLRADAIPIGPLSLVQWICFATIAASGIFLLKKSHQPASLRRADRAA